MAHPAQGLPYAIRVYGLSADGVRPTLSPVSTPAPDATVYAAGCGQDVVCLIREKDWDDEAAIRIATCESNLRADARNPSGASGVYQIMPQYHSWRLRPGESLFDPAVNVRIAYELYSEQGWQPWECSPW